MPLSEFDIIKNCFASRTIQRDDVKIGIGDDAAVMSVPHGSELVVAIDTLVDGVHFPVGTSAELIAWKSLAVNLSDLAAMGAEPAWFTLSLTMPSADTHWLEDFTTGLFKLADQYQLQLVGGDTTRGPLAITIQIAGYLPVDSAMTRCGAQPGDAIFITGTVGDAAAGLQFLQSGDIKADHSGLIGRLNRPIPRIETGLALREWATACIDVSDGLYADLGHILIGSGVGARLELEKLPLSNAFRQAVERDEQQWQLALSGGDDYELCFCIASEYVDAFTTQFANSTCPVTRIGEIEQMPGMRLFNKDKLVDLASLQSGYQHFR